MRFSALGRAVGFEAQLCLATGISHVTRFSALGRAVGFEARRELVRVGDHFEVSVLSVEPWGLKPSRHPHL